MPCTAWMKVSVQGISDGHKIYAFAYLAYGVYNS